MPPLGVLPITSTDLAEGLVRLEGRDPRFAQAPAGITPLNLAHDVFSAAQPDWKSAVWENDPATGRIRITMPGHYRDAAIRALSEAAMSPVVSEKWVPGWGDIAPTWDAAYQRQPGYLPPGQPFTTQDAPWVSSGTPETRRWQREARYWYGGPEGIPLLYTYRPPAPPPPPPPPREDLSAGLATPTWGPILPPPPAPTPTWYPGEVSREPGSPEAFGGGGTDTGGVGDMGSGLGGAEGIGGDAW